MSPAPATSSALAGSSAESRSSAMTGTASTPSRTACCAPSAIHRETEAGPSGPAAVGSCTYFGDRPAISAASSSSIAGRYSPLPTSATGPGLATLVRIQAVPDDRSPSSGHGSPIDLGSAFGSPRWSSWRQVGPLTLQLPQYPRLRGGGGG